MNKTVKILLACALGLLFPIFTLLLAITIFPENTSNRPQPPNYASNSSCYVDQPNTRTGRTSRVLEQKCVDRIQEANRKDREEYQREVVEYETKQKQVQLNRIKVALSLAIVGFVIALATWRATPVSAGLAAGSTIIIVVSSAYAAALAKYLDRFTAVLFLISFVALVAMVMMIDKIFPKIPAEEPQPNEASKQATDNEPASKEVTKESSATTNTKPGKTK